MTDLLHATPAAIVQAQLDAYNAHDVPALLAIYADDAQQFQHPPLTGSLDHRLDFQCLASMRQPISSSNPRLIAQDHANVSQCGHSVTGNDFLAAQRQYSGPERAHRHPFANSSAIGIFGFRESLQRHALIQRTGFHAHTPIRR